ncbi:hypothetical protein Golob_028002, partial [Gossypium lobatum]|nr:hypothetical protein [Gossypium lobatum]
AKLVSGVVARNASEEVLAVKTTAHGKVVSYVCSRGSRMSPSSVDGYAKLMAHNLARSAMREESWSFLNKQHRRWDCGEEENRTKIGRGECPLSWKKGKESRISDGFWKLLPRDWNHRNDYANVE